MQQEEKGVNMFWEFSEINKHKVAAVDEANSITFEQTLMEAEKIHSIINTKCVVLMLSDNSVGSFAGYVAFTHYECIVIVLESSVKLSFCQDMIEKYRPQFIWAQDSWKRALRLESSFDIYGYYLMRTGFAPYEISGSGGVVLSTSGSTGDVKCVWLGYAQMKKHAFALSNAIGFEKDDSAITTMPMAFVYTLSFINFHVMLGATIVLTNRSFMERQFWELFGIYQPTCISGLNLHYEMLQLVKFFEKDCSHMRIFTQGGDVFSAEMRERVKEYCGKFGKKCYILYGQTETGGTCGLLSLEEARGKKCIGRAISSGSFEMEAADGSGNGELIYCGQCAMLGYVTDAEDFKCIPKDRKVFTGDIVKRDNDGFYYIIGRKKRIVKLSGKRVNLDDIEHYIGILLDTVESACIGGKDCIWVFVASKQDERKEEQVKEEVKRFLGIVHVKLHFVYVDSLVRNESGKILYAKLEELIDKDNL